MQRAVAAHGYSRYVMTDARGTPTAYVHIKDLLDLIERGTAQPESFGNLHALLGKLAKTLSMVGLSSAANALQVQLPVVGSWSEEAPAAGADLHKLAEAVLYVESMVASLERGEQRNARPAPVAPGDEGEAFAAHQLAEARIVVVDEAQGGLALAKRLVELQGGSIGVISAPGEGATFWVALPKA